MKSVMVVVVGPEYHAHKQSVVGEEVTPDQIADSALVV
jgi:hypothetical protein